MTTSNRRKAGIAIAVAGMSASAASHAGTGSIITVTTRFDVTDFPAPQQVDQLPGPDGKVSFREACIAATSTPGPQTIHFAIPPEEGINPIAYLENDGGSFVYGDDGGLIDFTTQTAFTGDTNPNGLEVGIRGLQPNAMASPGIYVSGNNNTIKGVGPMIWRGYGVEISGNNNRVISSIITGPLYAGVYITGGFYGPPANGNIVGGTAPGEGNFLSAGNSGVRIDGPARNNVVIGNTLKGSFWGAEVRSATCCPEQDHAAIDNRIGGPTPEERNIIAGSGKFGEEGFPTGGQVTVEYSTGTIVEGNYIGVLEDGNTIPSSQRGPAGVRVLNSPGTIVRNNVISGIAVTGVNHAAGQRFGIGVFVRGQSDNTVIKGNRIGTNAAGVAALPNHQGLVVSTWPGFPNLTTLTIGGSRPGEGNIIAFNESQGISVATAIDGVRISGNSIHSNGTLGIDLLAVASPSSGVTPNDPLDADSGGNNLQNFPVITSATSTASGTEIVGTLHSTPNSTFTLEFFSNAVCDPSKHGEGETFIGSLQVTTDGQGNASFGGSVPSIEVGGRQITATATSASGDTSEFSACVSVLSSFESGDANADGAVNVDDLIAIILAWGECPPPPASCLADVNHDGSVDVDDLTMVVVNWS